MDEMRIKSKIFTGVISKVISKSLKKQVGVECEIKINQIVLANDGDKTNVQLDVEGCIETSKISEVIGKLMKD